MKINNGAEEVYFSSCDPSSCRSGGGREDSEKCSHLSTRKKAGILSNGQERERCTLFHKWINGRKCSGCQRAVRAAIKQGG